MIVPSLPAAHADPVPGRPTTVVLEFLGLPVGASFDDMVAGLQAPVVRIDALSGPPGGTASLTLRAGHIAERVRGRAPYVLMAYCSAATLALETARALPAAQVRGVVLINPQPVTVDLLANAERALATKLGAVPDDDAPSPCLEDLLHRFCRSSGLTGAECEFLREELSRLYGGWLSFLRASMGAAPVHVDVPVAVVRTRPGPDVSLLTGPRPDIMELTCHEDPDGPLHGTAVQRCVQRAQAVLDALVTGRRDAA